MGKTDCREVIEAFEAFLNAPEARRPEIAGVLAHLRTCPACRGRARHLVRLLAAEAAGEDDLSCQECEELLPGYLTAKSLGGADASEWVHVKRHLAACHHCAAAQASLAGLATLAYGESGVEPPSYPAPNLSFLRSREPATPGTAMTRERDTLGADAGPQAAASPRGAFRRGPESDLWQQAAQGVHRLAVAIPVLIGRAAASFGALAAPLTVQLAPVPVYRHKTPLAPAEEARDFAELLELPHPETNATLRLSLGPVFEGRGSLALAVNTIEPSQPIAQARVTLRDADGALLEGAFTGADGVVLFRDLDVGEYLVRVECAGQVWEFPLSLVLRAES